MDYVMHSFAYKKLGNRLMTVAVIERQFHPDFVLLVHSMYAKYITIEIDLEQEHKKHPCSPSLFFLVRM